MDVKPSLLPETIETPQQLLEALLKHDWYYAMSDDHREWRRGNLDAERLRKVAKEIPNGERIYTLVCKLRSLIDYGHE